MRRGDGAAAAPAAARGPEGAGAERGGRGAATDGTASAARDPAKRRRRAEEAGGWAARLAAAGPDAPARLGRRGCARPCEPSPQAPGRPGRGAASSASIGLAPASGQAAVRSGVERQGGVSLLARAACIRADQKRTRCMGISLGLPSPSQRWPALAPSHLGCGPAVRSAPSPHYGVAHPWFAMAWPRRPQPAFDPSSDHSMVCG